MYWEVVRTLRQNGINWWVNFFKDGRDTGTLNWLDTMWELKILLYLFHTNKIRPDCTAMEGLRDQWSNQFFGNWWKTWPGPFESHNLSNAINLSDVNVCKDMFSRPKRTLFGSQSISTSFEFRPTDAIGQYYNSIPNWTN